jgi:hypothetical protein
MAPATTKREFWEDRQAFFAKRKRTNEPMATFGLNDAHFIMQQNIRS